MSRELGTPDLVETRVLGAVRCVDAGTRALVTGPLELRALAGRARFIRNRGASHVLAYWSALAAHERSFAAPPAEPAVGSLRLPLAVVDPSGGYLPRRVTVALPRDPDPAHADAPDSLFRPIDVPLYPSPHAPTGANWGVLRVAVSAADSGAALGGVLLRARRGGEVIGRGLTDGRGEGLLALVGVPLMTFGEDDTAVLVDQLTVTVEAVFDPGAGTRWTPAARAAGVRPPVPEVDPDVLDADATLPATAQTLTVAARRSRSLTLTMAVP